MSTSCNFGFHKWRYCTCEACGQVRNSNHDWTTIESSRTEPDSCCWSADDPCTGPGCGTYCDQYYPGRDGLETQVRQCKVCGETVTWTFDGAEWKTVI